MSAPQAAIFCAVLAEARPLIGRLGLRRDDDWLDDHAVYVGETPAGPVVLVVSGVGARRASSAAAALFNRAEPKLAVIAGLAAALSPALHVGDLVIPDRVIDSVTGKTHHRTAHHGSTGRLVSVDRVLTRPDDKRAMHERFEAGAADMESAAVARVCESHRVPWLCVRAISDAADQRLPAGLEGVIDDDGSASAGKAVGYALTHPFDIGALIRLGRGAKRGADALADAAAGLLTPS